MAGSDTALRFWTYTAPRTGYDISAGQTFDQRRMEEMPDGTFRAFLRTIIVGMHGGMDNQLSPWRPHRVGMTRDDARRLAGFWSKGGFHIHTTRAFGLENIDAQTAKLEAGRAAARARREARREARLAASDSATNSQKPTATP